MPSDLQPRDSLPPDWLPPDWPPSDQLPPDQPPPCAPPILINHGLQVYLQHPQLRLPSTSLSSLDLGSKWITKFTSSWPPSASLSFLDPSVSKCISKLAWSRPASASLSSLDISLHVQLQTCSIMVSKYILKECCWLYGDTWITEVDNLTGSIHSADPGVDRHHLNSISSYHTLIIHTLSFPTFGLMCSVRDFVDLQCRVVSYLPTRLLYSSKDKHSVSWIQCGCRERYGGLLMVGSLPSCSNCFTTKASKWCIYKFSQWVCAGTPLIMLEYHLGPDWPFRYIERALNNACHIML